MEPPVSAHRLDARLDGGKRHIERWRGVVGRIRNNSVEECSGCVALHAIQVCLNYRSTHDQLQHKPDGAGADEVDDLGEEQCPESPLSELADKVHFDLKLEESEIRFLVDGASGFHEAQGLMLLLEDTTRLRATLEAAVNRDDWICVVGEHG